MNRRKTRAAYRISQNAKGHVEDTAPELAIDEICRLHNADSFKPEPMSFVAPDRDDVDKVWTVKPDREVVIVSGCPFTMHADGPHHWTETFRKKDDWQDEQLIERGLALRILRVDSPLLVRKRHWDYVWKAMKEMAFGNEVRRRLYA